MCMSTRPIMTLYDYFVMVMVCMIMIVMVVYLYKLRVNNSHIFPAVMMKTMCILCVCQEDHNAVT